MVVLLTTCFLVITWLLISANIKLGQENEALEKKQSEADKKLQQLTSQGLQLQARLQKGSQAYQSSQQRVTQLEKKYGGIISREEEMAKLDAQLVTFRTQRVDLSGEISTLEQRLKKLEELDFVEGCGFYESKYDFGSSVDYKQRLDEIRAEQKQLIKKREAVTTQAEWTLGESKKDGKKLIENLVKLMLRAFNGECDAAVSKVKYNNIQTLENRINKAYDDINRIAELFRCEISSRYLQLKLQELWLTHEYQDKKYQEQEEQRQIREQMREEERALKELEKAKQDAEREERRYQEALDKARREIESATGAKHDKLLQQIDLLQQQVAEAEANKQRAISQAQLTKTGHVYVISNIGSFGDEVYKIGMTRRLDPMDRVKELGDASVPFPFDVHAMIYCENAPEMEARLHREFHQRRVNKINERKEFFRVQLDEIIAIVKQVDAELGTCKSEVSFTKVAEAAEYRRTIAQDKAHAL